VAWIAATAGPGTSYLALVTPMIIIGAGFALAIPAVTRSVTSTVPPADLGPASAAFTTMRQLGGAFGVAVLGAAFAATGGYATPAVFSHGFTTAFAVAAALALTGTAAGTVLAGRGNAQHPRLHPRPAGLASASETAATRNLAAPQTRTAGERPAPVTTSRPTRSR
jgi:MFS family permease